MSSIIPSLKQIGSQVSLHRTIIIIIITIIIIIIIINNNNDDDDDNNSNNNNNKRVCRAPFHVKHAQSR